MLGLLVSRDSIEGLGLQVFKNHIPILHVAWHNINLIIRCIQASVMFQQQLPRRLATLKITMGLNDLLQRIDLMDLNLELAGLEQTEQLVHVILQLLPSLDISE